VFEWNCDGNGEARLFIGGTRDGKEAAQTTLVSSPRSLLEPGLKKTRGQKQWVHLNFDGVVLMDVLFKENISYAHEDLMYICIFRILTLHFLANVLGWKGFFCKIT
jgi:hypothetical protein